MWIKSVGLSVSKLVVQVVDVALLEHIFKHIPWTPNKCTIFKSTSFKFLKWCHLYLNKLTAMHSRDIEMVSDFEADLSTYYKLAFHSKNQWCIQDFQKDGGGWGGVEGRYKWKSSNSLTIRPFRRQIWGFADTLFLNLWRKEGRGWERDDDDPTSPLNPPPRTTSQWQFTFMKKSMVIDLRHFISSIYTTNFFPTIYLTDLKIKAFSFKKKVWRCLTF